MDLVHNYQPHSWQIKFHTGDWKHAALVGGKGGGKTKAALEELLACAMETPATTYLIGRKTLPSLLDSTWKELLSLIPEELISDYNKALRNVKLVNGSMFIGRPLDEPKKFDSLQISGFFLDEADELDEVVWKTLKDRMREIKRDPLGRKIMPRYRGIIGLNPTDEDHWIPMFFMNTLKPKDHHIFFSSTLDNMENLPDDYVEQLKANYSEDMQQRIIYGHFGKVHKGRPVFPSFARGNYIRPIEPVKGTVFRSWDFGFNNPACVWFQFIDGQMTVLAEKMGRRIYLDDFIRECLSLQEELFNPIVGQSPFLFKDFCDPHGADESDKGGSSVAILHEFGIYPVFRKTFIEEGIKAIKELLDTKTLDDDPRFLIHGRCRTLIEGFRGGYHRLDGEDKPAKDGHYDHLFDSLRYGAIHCTKRFKFNRMQTQINDQENVWYSKNGRRIEY